MKPQLSSLNPYAASYIPLSKRVADGGNSVTENDSMKYDGTVWFQTPQHITKDHQFVDSSTYAAKSLSTPATFPLKNQSVSSSYGSLSQNVVDKQLTDEELDMDMEYLRMTFPGISDQSLVDVYTLNRGDLDAAIDMLNQLEV